MKYVFKGDPRDPKGKHDPDTVTIRGVTFPKDVPVEVSDPVVLGKLSGNSHFELAKGKPGPKPKNGNGDQQPEPEPTPDGDQNEG